MIEAIIGILLLTIIVAWYYRRRIHKQVEQLDQWKINLENSPFSHQLARVKNMTMAGQAEEAFNTWKSKWESVLNTALPDIEETLLTIEEYANRFMFFKCKPYIEQAHQQLASSEQQLNRIQQEIDHLLASEEQSHDRFIALHEKYQVVKNAFQQHARSLDEAYPYWQEQMVTVSSWLEEVHLAVQSGNYFEALDILHNIEQVLSDAERTLEELPELIKRTKADIPKKIRELEQGLQQMSDEGYSFVHLALDERFAKWQEWEQETLKYIASGRMDALRTSAESIEKEIDDTYALLEQEVQQRAFIMRTIRHFPKTIAQVRERFRAITEVVNQTKASYSWSAEKREVYDQLERLVDELELVTAHIQVSDEQLESQYVSYQSHAQQVDEKLDKFNKLIRMLEQYVDFLRVDEREAQEAVKELQVKLNQVQMRLRRANLPRIPKHVREGMQTAQAILDELHVQLGQVPLNLDNVQRLLKDARSELTTVDHVSRSIIDQMQQAERTIQYANRYRRKDDHIQRLLQEAEHYFHESDYSQAINRVQQALDAIDPNWREKIRA